MWCSCVCIFLYVDVCSAGGKSDAFFREVTLQRKKAEKIKGKETFLSVSHLSCDARWVLFQLLFRKVEKKKKNNDKKLRN